MSRSEGADHGLRPDQRNFRKSALAGAFSFRDLGGLSTADGRRTRSGLVYRSNGLHQLTEGDIDAFRHELRIATVIDLRSPGEVARGGPGPLDALPLRRLNLPLVRDVDTGPLVGARDFTDHAERYRDYLRHAGPNLVAALSTIAGDGALPVVFHCTAGKDRTGVVAALLLGCLGVTDDEIVADYGAVNGERRRLVEFLHQVGEYTDLPEDHWLLDSRPETMAAFLTGLEDHGGPAGWALSAGLPEATLARLRTLLLEPH